MEKQRSTVTTGIGQGPQVNPWMEWEAPARSRGKAAPGEPRVDPLRPVPTPWKPQEGWPGGKKALVLEQKTKHSFLVLGSLPRAGDEAPPGRTGLTRFGH